MTQTTGLDVFPANRTFVTQETYDAFFAVVARLEATIANENIAIQTSRHADLVQLTRQKRQGYLELSRVMQSLASTIPSQDILARLASFQTTLNVNDRLLRTHLDAMKEVTDVIIRAMHEAESDGTYSRNHAHASFRHRGYDQVAFS